MWLGDLIKTFGQEYTSSNEAGGGDLEIGSGFIFRFALYFFCLVFPPAERMCDAFGGGVGGGRGPVKGTAQ